MSGDLLHLARRRAETSGAALAAMDADIARLTKARATLGHGAFEAGPVAMIHLPKLRERLTSDIDRLSDARQRLAAEVARDVARAAVLEAAIAADAERSARRREAWRLADLLTHDIGDQHVVDSLRQDAPRGIP